MRFKGRFEVELRGVMWLTDVIVEKDGGSKSQLYGGGKAIDERRWWKDKLWRVGVGSGMKMRWLDKGC